MISSENTWTEFPNSESRRVSTPQDYSTFNGTTTIPLPGSNGSLYEQRSSFHELMYFDQGNQYYHPRQFWRGNNGFDSRRGRNGNGFQNRNYSNRRNPHHGYDQRNTNSRFNNAGRPMRPQYPPPRFPNRPVGLPQYPQPFSTPIANPPPYINAPHRQPPPPPPYYSGPYLPETNTSLRFTPPPSPVPFVENMQDPASYPQPPQQCNLPDSDQMLCNAILEQIEYYFSDENLRDDFYLKKNMDEQGWVSIHLIAGFNRIKCKTNDINLILKALQPSEVIEVQGEKVRKRENWMTWIPPLSSSSTTQAHLPDGIVAAVENIQLDEVHREAERS